MSNIVKPSGLSSIWAAGGTKINPGSSKVNLGWVVQLPPYEFQNWVDNRQDHAIAHINQHGIPEWDSATEYQGLLSYTQGSNGKVYKCLTTHNGKDPTNNLNGAFWTVAFEDFGSVALVTAALNTHITNYQTLSGIGNLAAARNNLSVFSRVESDARFAGLNGDQSQVFSVGVATQPNHAVRLSQVASLLTQATEASLGVVRLSTTGVTELGLDDLTAITPLKANTVFLKKSGNLSGLGNLSVARANLGLGSSATFADTAFVKTSNNLGDLPDKVSARANLGLTSTAVQPETHFLRTSLNLSDVASPLTARTNLGLGGSAVLNVGTVANTVAAGNDARIVNAVPNTRTVTAGNGLTGGGTLNGNLTLALGTPTSLTGTSTNTVTGASHSHAVDINSFFGSRSLTPDGHYTLPGGFCMQWGTTPQVGGDNTIQTSSFNIPFTECLFVQVGTRSSRTSSPLSNTKAELIDFNEASFRWGSDSLQSTNYPIACTWIAVGRV